MILTVAFALLAPVALPATAPATDDGLPVRLWMNSNRAFDPGDPVKVQVETGRIGYLLVLQLDPAGKVKVLFPIEPGDDARVQTGRRYEIQNDQTGRAFVATDGGVGLVYAALAEDPFRFDGFAAPSGSWDTGALAIDRDTEDPEADLTAIVQRMVSGRGFDYDVLEYQVAGRVAEGAEVPAWWSPTYMVSPYDGCYGCGVWGGGGVYVSVGLGWAWPYYHNPWGWNYGYYGYYPYGGYYGGYYPYYPYYPPYYPGYYPPGGYYPSGNTPAVVGRPRGYTVEPRNPYGIAEPRNRGGQVQPSPEAGKKAPAPARRARPVSGERTAGAGRPEGQSGQGGSASPGKNSGGTSSGTSGASGGGSRARPRGGRPETESQLSTGPSIERERPTARQPTEWVRVEDGPAARRSGARPEQSGSSPESIRARSRGTADAPARAAPAAVPRPTGWNRTSDTRPGTLAGAQEYRGAPPARRATPRGNDLLGGRGQPATWSGVARPSGRSDGGSPRSAGSPRATPTGERSGAGARPPSSGGSISRPSPGSNRGGGGVSAGGGSRPRGRP